MNDGRFAGPVGAHKASNFSCLNDERDVVDRLEVAVGFRQALDGDEHRDTLRYERIQNKLFEDYSLRRRQAVAA
jgi:hypothetical protein